MTYKIYLCGADEPCPNDEDFQHISIMGPVCVPGDFSQSTGRSKTHKQTLTKVDGLPYELNLWDGGCDAVGLTARQRVEDYQRHQARGGKSIVLKMKP